MLYDGISKDDVVVVTPQPSSGYLVKQHVGQQCRVISRNEKGIVVEFASGANLLVNRNEVAKVGL